MTDFTYVSQMNCRFIFNNPSTAYAFFSIKVKAFGGTKSASNLYGDKYMGFWDFNDIFQIANSVSVASNIYYSTDYTLPSKSPWRDNTIHYVFSQNANIGGTRMSIAQVTLSDSGSTTYNDKLFCKVSLGSANFYDDLLDFTLVISGRTYRYAYFITTWQGTTSSTHGYGNGWPLKYLKCKYYADPITAYFFFSDTSI